jgi:predicted small lipoprotein YifL
MKILTLLPLLFLSFAACGLRPSPQAPPAAPVAAFVTVPTVSHAADGAPLCRAPDGRFAKWYWVDGKLHAPQGIRADELALAREMGEAP